MSSVKEVSVRTGNTVIYIYIYMILNPERKGEKGDEAIFEEINLVTSRIV